MILLAQLMAAALMAGVFCGLVIRASGYWQLGLDRVASNQPQKFHCWPTSRLGGVGILLSLVLMVFLVLSQQDSLKPLLASLLVASLPAFLGGIGEDLTGRFRPSIRLLLTFVAAGIAWFIADAELTRVGVIIFDQGLARWAWLSILFTMFAVGGVSHSINIIDGYNGLMAGVCLLACLVFAFIAWDRGDLALMRLSLVLSASIVGFMVWNVPWGKLFMGDGGSYLVGFLIAEIAVLLVARHQQISPWSAFLIMVYPITETLFSIYRKKILRSMSPGQPDGLHLHMLVYKKIFLRYARQHGKSRNWCHALTSLSLVGFASLPMMAALMVYQSTWQCLLAVLGFVVIYVGAYWKLIGR